MDIFSLLGLALGVFFWFIVFDSICVKLFKIDEVKSVWYSFILLVLFFLVYSFSENGFNLESNLIIRLILSILFLVVFIFFAKKDEKEKKRLIDLPSDTNINLSELATISNKSEKKLKYLISKGILSTVQTESEEILFKKGIALQELNSKD